MYFEAHIVLTQHFMGLSIVFVFVNTLKNRFDIKDDLQVCSLFYLLQ